MITDQVRLMECLRRAIKRQSDLGKNSDQLSALLTELEQVNTQLDKEWEERPGPRTEAQVVL